MGIVKGRHTYVGDELSIMAPDIVIGSFTSMAGGLIFHGSSTHRSDTVSTFPFKERLNWPEFNATNRPGRKIIIGNDVYIGNHVTFLDGVIVGDGAVIGAGSVLRGEYEPYGVYIGNPARLIRKRFDDDVIAALLRIKWWDWSDDQIRQRLNEGLSVRDFVIEYDM